MSDNGGVRPDVRDAFDAIIEDVTREMLAGEPDPSLRARVMDRLGEQRSPWRAAWILSPVAVAAVVFITMLVQRTAGPRPISSLADGARPLLSAHRITPLGAPPVVPHSGAGPIDRDGSHLETRTATALSSVAALAPPRLEVPSLAITAMDSGPSLQVPELETITPMAVTPIGEPQGERQ